LKDEDGGMRGRTGLLRKLEEVSKRVLDVAGASIGLAATAPILLGAATAIRLTMGGPVLFRQERPGLHRRPFVMYKFRTMREAKSGEDEAATDAVRLTAVGRWLRGTSVDELPTLFNVLRGDMSLVGPRPLLMRYVPYFTAREQLRHEMRPGITGWAQINGRNEVCWDRRLAHDVWYVENWSLRLDTLILLRTCSAVVRRDGVVTVPGEKMKDLDQERADAGRR
jgi:sugar transferase EpsL